MNDDAFETFFYRTLAVTVGVCAVTFAVFVVVCLGLFIRSQL